MSATLDQFRNAILAGSNLNVPGVGGSPNMGGAGTANADTAIGHLQGLARSSFQVPAVSTAAGAAGGQAQNEDDAAKAAAKLKLQEVQDQLDQANQAKKDLNDPSKYTRQQNQTGGWDFYGPDGSKITAQQYAQVKGQHVTDALKGSQNTKDQEFLQDYQDVTKLGQVMQSGDKKALEKLYASDPTLKKRIGNMTYSDIVKNFRSSYPDYFPTNTTTDVGNSSYGGTSPNKLGGGGGNFLQKLMSFFSQ